MIRCLIVDDEPLGSKVIETFLIPLKGFELVATAESATEAYSVLSAETIDLIFLDLNMPEISGLEFLKNLSNPPLVIVTTAYREYAVEGYDLDVVDYLVKPIPLPRFNRALEKAKKRLESNEQTINIQQFEKSKDQYVLLKVDKKTLRVDLADIYYIESLKDYIRVKTKIGNFTTHQSLSAICEILPEDNFIRIHRSFAIALNKVNALLGNAVEINGQLLPIGRNYLSEVKGKILGSGLKGS